MVLAASYQGNLVAFMTNPGFQDAIDTPGKLIEKGIPVGMYNYQGSTTLAFQASSNPQYCEIWSAKNWITSFDESYKKTIKGKETSFMLWFNEAVKDVFQGRWCSWTTDSL